IYFGPGKRPLAARSFGFRTEKSDSRFPVSFQLIGRLRPGGRIAARNRMDAAPPGARKGSNAALSPQNASPERRTAEYTTKPVPAFLFALSAVAARAGDCRTGTE